MSWQPTRAELTQPVQKGKKVTYVERDESDKDPKVSPPIRVLDVERKVQELVGGSEWAKLTGCGGIRVGEVASGTRDIRTHVLRASQTGWWIEGRVFDI